MLDLFFKNTLKQHKFVLSHSRYKNITVAVKTNVTGTKTVKIITSNLSLFNGDSLFCLENKKLVKLACQMIRINKKPT